MRELRTDSFTVSGVKDETPGGGPTPQLSRSRSRPTANQPRVILAAAQLT